MKTTPFIEKHLSLGARMQEFAGFNMPISYKGILEEHMNVLKNVGVFDVSHMGEIWVKGKNARSFLQKVTSNDVSKLVDGKAQYACMTNEHGGIVDDLVIYRYNEEKYLLVVNASNIEKDWKWLVSHNDEQVELENASEWMAQLAVQGPKAIQVLQKLTSIDLSKIPYYGFQEGIMAGVDRVIISNTGYTGAGGFELYCYNEDGLKIWDAIFEKGQEENICPVGLGARDTLRLEKGYALYGHDLNDDTTPIEAGLSWITKLTPEKPLIGKDILLDQKMKGVKQSLIGFEMVEKGIPRQGYIIEDKNGNLIGKVTSGSISPFLNKGIGMGYVLSDFTHIDTPINIRIRDRAIPAQVVKMPFRK